MTPFLRRLLYGLLFGVLVYGAFVVYAGYGEIKDSLQDFRWLAFAAALGLASFNYFLRFLKWEYYLAQLRVNDVPKGESLLVFLSGFVLTITPGKVGEVFKSAVLFDTHKVPVMVTAPIVVAERLTDVISIVVLIVIGSVGFPDGLPWAAAGAAVVATFLTILLWQKPVLLGLRWMQQRPGWVGRLAPKLEQAWHSLRIVARPSALFLPTLVSTIGWGAEGLALYLIVSGFGVAISLPLCIFFYATATLAGALVPVPGGLGVAETIIRQQLVHVGHAPAGVATASMLMTRIATLWWAVVVGFIALSLLKRRYPSLLKNSTTAKVGLTDDLHHP